MWAVKNPRATRAACALLVGLTWGGGVFGSACSSKNESIPAQSAPDAAGDPNAIVKEDARPATIDAGSPATIPYPFDLPMGFPKALVPATNPLTPEKAELGRHLFYDTRLSGNGTQSCASCHEQARAFTDGRVLAVGSTGQMHPRNSMSLANVVYAGTLTWPNPLMRDLETQAAVPMFGLDPIVELGGLGKEEEILARLRADTKYRDALFPAAFPNEASPFTMTHVQRALASFERIMVSGDSRFDRFLYRGELNALTPQEKRGYELFQSEACECFHCHSGFNFTDAVVFVNSPADLKFHNTGLYNIGGTGAFPIDNRGLIEFTGVPSDMGRFKAPTLRNIEKTAPYMHDGSIATLEEVIEHYAAGGRTITSGPNAGVGHASPFKSGFMVGFTLPQEDKAALVAFLKSLTDEGFLTNPKLANPWR